MVDTFISERAHGFLLRRERGGSAVRGSGKAPVAPHARHEHLQKRHAYAQQLVHHELCGATARERRSSSSNCSNCSNDAYR